MMVENKQELIEKYLRGNMEATERQVFEQQMAEDEQLAIEVEENRQGNQMLEAYFEQQMLSNMIEKGKRMLSENQTQPESIEEDIGEDTPVVSLPQKQNNREMVWLGIAAAILLIASIAALQFGVINFSSSTPDQIVADAYAAEDLSNSGLLAPIEPEADIEKQFQQGLQAFNIEDYRAAELIFDYVLQDSSFTRGPRARLLLGVTLLRSARYQAANKQFEQIPEAATRYHQQGQWFRALSLWKNNQKEEAQKLWAAIAGNNNHMYVTQAQDIIRKIK